METRLPATDEEGGGVCSKGSKDYEKHPLPSALQISKGDEMAKQPSDIDYPAEAPGPVGSGILHRALEKEPD